MRIIGAGLITADIIVPCDSSWRPLEGSPGYFAGGTVGNILSHLAWFGWDCSVLGGVGDDPLGPIVRQDFARVGVNTTGLASVPAKSTRRIGEFAVTLGEHLGEHRFFEKCYRCGRQFPPFPIPSYDEFVEQIAELLNGRTALIIDRANEFTLALARRVHEGGGVTVFEPGYLSRNATTVEELLQVVDLLKYSEELKFQGGLFKHHQLAHSANLKLVIETRSRAGVIARRQNTEIRLTTTPILQVVDPVGAGDAFMAGFLTGIAEEGLFGLSDLPDSDLEDALERGQALGGLACRFVGAKGILWEKRAAVESAITQVVTTRISPTDFGGTTLRHAEYIIPASANRCDVCLLS